MKSDYQLRLMGSLVGAGEFHARVARRDPALEQLIVSQIIADKTAASRTSDGLIAVDLAWRRAVQGYLVQEFFRSTPDSAEPVWNDTLRRVFDNIDKFDSRLSRFTTWVFNQARYAALDHVRRTKRAERELRSLVADPTSVGASESEPLLVGVRERSALRRALRKLSALDRELIRLRFIEDMTYDEVYEELGGRVKRDHVRIAMARATTRFRTAASKELERTDQ